MSGLPVLRVADSGRVLVHFSLQPGIGDRAGEVMDAVESFGIKSPKFAWVLGESDLFLDLELEDFRSIRGLQSSLAVPGSRGSTWLFCVPYSQGSLVPERSDCALYVIYLRVNRSLYRALGVVAENYIVARLQELIARFDGIYGDISLCLGSPDLILSGSFDCPAQKFLPFLAAIRGLATPEVGVNLFSATRSLIGFPWLSRDINSLAGAKQFLSPVIFAKVSSRFLGQLKNVQGDVSRLLGHDAIKASYFLDGKHDLILMLDRESVGTHELRSILASLYASGSISTETHILAGDPNEILVGLEKTSTDVVVLEDDIEGACACSEVALLVSVSQADLDILPKGLRADVESILSLFRLSLAERANCCDNERSLRACTNGLRILLDLLVRCQVSSKSFKTPELQDRNFRWIFRYRQAIAEWCRYAERVLRERTADSVDSLFRGRTTLSETRGSLQKLLFLADELLVEFYSGIDRAVKKEDPGDALFATIYEPIATIVSQRHTGIIRIPSRFAFSLHLVLPQLWHEVGQFIFQNRYGYPHAPLTNKLLKTLKSHGDQRSFEFLLTEAADHYADLLVLYYGFKGDLQAFNKYLVSLVLDEFLYDQVPQASQGPQLELLIRRLFHVAHFDLLLEKMRGRSSGEDLEQLLVNSSANFMSDNENVYDAAEQIWLIQGVKRYRNQDLLLRPRGRPKGGVDVAESALGNLQKGVYSYAKSYMAELLTELSQCAPVEESPGAATVWEQVSHGHVVEMSRVRATDLYLHLYKADLERLLATPYGEHIEPDFRTMAALGRSCTLSIYKRNKRPRA